jgi:hypothetical protein
LYLAKLISYIFELQFFCHLIVYVSLNCTYLSRQAQEPSLLLGKTLPNFFKLLRHLHDCILRTRIQYAGRMTIKRPHHSGGHGTQLIRCRCVDIAPRHLFLASPYLCTEKLENKHQMPLTRDIMSALEVLVDPVCLGSTAAMASTWAHGAMGPRRERKTDSDQD